MICWQKNIVFAYENLKPEAVGSKAINFSVDAIGRLLDGDEGNIIDDNYDTKREFL